MALQRVNGFRDPGRMCIDDSYRWICKRNIYVCIFHKYIYDIHNYICIYAYMCVNVWMYRCTYRDEGTFNKQTQVSFSVFEV